MMRIQCSSARKIALSSFAILTIFVMNIERGGAVTTCKRTVRDVFEKQCIEGYRDKRSLEKFDDNLKKKFEKLAWAIEKDESEESGKSEDVELIGEPNQGIPQKRQLSPEAIAHIAMPIVSGAVYGLASARSAPRSYYRGPRPDPAPYPPYPIQHQRPGLISNYLPPPFGHNRLSSYFPSLSGSNYHDRSRRSLLPLTLSDTWLDPYELMEIYNEVSHRYPRKFSNAEVLKAFKTIAQECCNDLPSCNENPPIFICP